MAAMFGAGTSTLFNINKTPNPSLPLRSPALRTQRICFPLAHNSSRDYSHAAGEEGTAAETKDKTKGTVKKEVEKARESAETVTERTKEGMTKVVEATQSVGDEAEQMVQEAWDAAKETTQKIKETVAAKPEDDGDDDPNKRKY